MPTPQVLLEVSPLRKLAGRASIPSSKPETQRAIIAATLSTGKSTILNDLRCVETTAMKDACKALGARIVEHEGFLEIEGVGAKFDVPKYAINAKGSGLVFRVFSALTCFAPGPTAVTGDATLRNRVMSPLFEALVQLGATIECVGDEGKAPIVNWGGRLRGGRCTLPGNVSSQFVTAVLLAAPLSEGPTEIAIEGEILSSSYIRQTIAAMENAGIHVDASDDLSSIHVYPGEYRPARYMVSGDYTSSSYLIGAATMFQGTTILDNMDRDSLQGERAIIDVVRALGLSVHFDDAAHQLHIVNPHTSIRGNFEFDASDFPNIVPTLAAIGAYVEGTFRVVGGSITRLHKSPRIKAIVSELKTMGVNIRALFRDGVYDGFEINGTADEYQGGVTLSSWGDHRIFMSLFVASLRCRKANLLDGFQDVSLSFPDFFAQFAALGATSRQTSIASHEDDVELAHGR